MAYVMQKAPYVFPIIGCRKVERLQANLEALGIVLTRSHRASSNAVPFDPGFPTTTIVVFAFVRSGRSNLLFVRFCRTNPEFEMGL